MEKFNKLCRHYNGLHSKVCRAGVSYEDMKDPGGDILHLPCFKDQECTERCEKVSFLAPEEILYLCGSIVESAQATKDAIISLTGTPEKAC